MHSDEQLFTYHMSRRGLLAASGAVGAGLAAGVLVADPADAATTPGPAGAANGAGSAPSALADLAAPAATADPVTTPRVAGLHTQFGSDASREVVVSWHTLQPVSNARVLLGGADGRFQRTFHA